MDGTSAATRAITGEFGFVLYAAVPLALLASLFLLWLFLGAVKRSMRRGGDAPAELEAAQPPPPEAALVFEEIAASGGGQLLVGWRPAIVYGLGGVAYGLAMAALYLVANDLEFFPRRYLYLALTYMWPGVLAVGLVAATSWRGWALLLGGYALLVFGVLRPLLGVQVGAVEMIGAWAITNGIGTVLIGLFLARPIRAVGPLTLVFMVAALGGAALSIDIASHDEGLLRAIVGTGGAIGLGGTQVFYALMAAGAFVMAVVGWALLQVLGRLYRHGAITDQSLTVDAVFVFFALDHGLDFAFAHPAWFFSGLLAVVAYQSVTLLGFAVTRGKPAAAPRVLLLRVFSLGKRSERLFDAFAKLWRRKGAIRMIAGPDLATSTVEPHEFLDFLQGRLSRRFVADAAGLEQRMAEGAEERRYDGRYGVNELFCQNNTWKLALQRLLAGSDAVLMDLRGFTPANKGCIYEVEALLDAAPLAKVTFVIDATTDAAFLRQTFEAGWAKVNADSPNRHDPAPRVRLFPLGKGGRDVRALIAATEAAVRA